MNRHLALVVGLLSVMVAPRAGARMNEAEFVLANQHSESIRVEFRDKTGKTVAEKTIKPGGEIALHASRRIVVHIGGEAREYALPVSLYLWSSGNRLVPDRKSVV